ncbi:MAG: S8 family serine peptidase [Flavobacteriales bacterium]|nr:S8 family serine peptidase [Flavobacteriales bacterium]
MKQTLLLSKVLIVFFTFCFLSSSGQNSTNYELFLKAKKFTPQKTTNFDLALTPTVSEFADAKIFRLVQFYNIPSEAQKINMSNNGIELLSYIPNNAFICSINKSVTSNDIANFDIRSIIHLMASHKISKELTVDKLPKHAMIGKDVIQLKVKYYLSADKIKLANYIRNSKGKVVSALDQINTLYIEYNSEKIEVLASCNLVQWIEAISSPDVKDDREGRSLHRSNAINTQSISGRKYDGAGVVIAIADDGDIGPHIDYEGRLTLHSGGPGGSHGDMTTGIMYGAGNLDPKMSGMASGAYMHYYDIGGYPHVIDGVNNMVTLGTVVTSTSYSQGTGGEYTSDTEFIDQQVNQNQNIIHVFSAGNAGTSDHGYGAGAGWGNITGGYKAGKNVITSGNLNNVDVLENSSSRGPAADGRIKPDLCANGINQMSTAEFNTYQVGGGTSAAAPGIAGVVTQLYQAYKDVNGGTEPATGLLKASLLNTAEDLGNPGPDYKHGWGRINGLKAVRIIEENRYFTGSATQGSNNAHNITVPANVSQVRIMTYWMDVQGNPVASKALVNDINMQVVDPVATSYDPWILDPTPNATNLDQVATRGVDNLNNMEQVTINNPAAGSYTVNVNGFAIPQGPQEYFVLYDFIYDGVELTYPIGREGFDPGTTEIIRWDAFGNTGTFNLEYSTNNGGSWNTINGAVNGNLRFLSWSVPSALTGVALVRVTRGASASVSDEVFSIIDTPNNLVIDWICPDSLQMSWNPVTGATAYEVSMLGVMYMDSVGVTTNTSYVFHGMNPTVINWFSVRTHGPTNARGERAIAIEKSIGTFNCPIAIDVELSGLDPFDAAQLLDCMGANLDVDISIKNDGQNVLSNIPVHYQLNGGTAVNEVYAGPLSPGATITHTFATQITPVIGANTLLVWSDMSGDGNFYNDSVTAQFTYIGSTLQSLPWSEDFESFSLCGTTSNCEGEVCGLTNDFINETNLVVDDIDWRTDRGGTPSNNTGPSVDFNPGTSTGKYLYLETSTCYSKLAHLVSPCIDLTSAVGPQLDFAYHMNGATMGTLFLDVYSNGSWTNNVSIINGNQGSNWLVNSVSLTPYIGNIINLRFRGLTGSSFTSDIAIDDINISDPLDVNELSNSLNFSIYPNPSTGLYNYTYIGNSELSVELFDVNGKVIYSKNISADSSTKNGVMDIRSYANGIYMMVLTSGSDRITKKIIKR